jgi:UDP-glucose 4-epimerase
MKILVVGGAGFIGSHLVDALIIEGHEVSVADNLFLGKEENIPIGVHNYQINASDFEELRWVFAEQKSKIVFNLAVLPLPHSLISPHVNVTTNIEIVNNLCSLLQEGKYKRLIHFSSSEVYGTSQYEPMCEKHPLEPTTPYAASKAAGDFICMSYVKTFGCDITIVRPFNTYGPRQNAGSYAGIIPLTINRILKGEAPVIYGDGEQTRDYIYVKDIVRAAMMLMKRDDLKGEIFNIGSGHDVSIHWLVFAIMSLLEEKGYSPKPIWQEPARPGDVRRHIANVLKAKDILGFSHEISMAEGLQKTIDWYLNQVKI